MSSTVQVGGMEVESSNESAADMMQTLKPKEESKESRILVDRGKPVEPEESKASEAARELGKRGGEASAKAREERAKETKAEATSAPEAEEPEEGDEKGENPRHSARARVEQATRQLAEERRARAEERQRWEDRIARLEQNLPKTEPETRPAARPAADGRPILDDFATHEEWLEALTEWKIEQREKKTAQEAQQREAVERFGKRAGDFHDRIAKAAGDDGEQVKAVLPLLRALKTREMLEPGEWEHLSAQDQAAVDLAEEIVDCERPLDVLRFLVEHPDEYRSVVNSKDAFALRRAFGRLMGRLEAQDPGEVPKERPQSAAPAPFRPVGSSPQPSDSDLMNMDLDSYAARMKGRKR